MSRAFVICSALCVTVSLVHAKHFGNGVWERLSITKCEEDSHKFKFDMALMKINDTHDGFKGHIVFDEDFDDTFGTHVIGATSVLSTTGYKSKFRAATEKFLMEKPITPFKIRLEICKIEDDSCKQSQVIVDDSLIEFFERYAKDSVADCLKAASLDPPEMPIPKGEYDIESYAFSNEPTSSMFGTFNFKAFVLQGDDEVGCMETRMKFKKIETEEENKEEK